MLLLLLTELSLKYYLVLSLQILKELIGATEDDPDGTFAAQTTVKPLHGLLVQATAAVAYPHILHPNGGPTLSTRFLEPLQKTWRLAEIFSQALNTVRGNDSRDFAVRIVQIAEDQGPRADALARLDTRGELSLIDEV